MIIQNLRAHNILKYARLELTGIPEKGLIAISGPNESGKTALVETICLALFGRTFARPAEQIDKVIRWGETEGSVELDFLASDGNHYTVVRGLDHNGVQSAELHIAGETTPLATGPQTVNDAIEDLSKINFIQYLDAVYLAQREISEPHSQSQTIKTIAGAGDLETVIAQLSADRQREQAALADIDDEVQRIHGRIETLGGPEHTIADLEQQRQQLSLELDEFRHEIQSDQQALEQMVDACARLQTAGEHFTSANLDTSLVQWNQHAEELSQAVDQMQQVCGRLQLDAASCDEVGLEHFVEEFQARTQAFDPVREHIGILRQQLGVLLGERATAPEGDDTSGTPLPAQQRRLRRRRASNRALRLLLGLLFLVLLVASLGAWGGWWWLNHAPDLTIAGYTSSWPQEHLDWWQAGYAQRLLPIAALLSVVTLILWGLSRVVRQRLLAIQREIREYERRNEEAHQGAELLEQVDTLPLPEAVERLRRLGDQHINRALRKFVDDPRAALISASVLAESQARLKKLLAHCSGSTTDLRTAVAAKQGKLERRIEENEERIATIHETVTSATTRLEEARYLADSVATVSAGKAAHEREIQVLDEALRLARANCQGIYNRFNQLLSQHTADVLPLLTEGRYGQLRIDEQFRVRVFSKDKNDFAELDEFSSGAQRQTLLAVRLAMAKALMEATHQSRQFLILDEPFAFFDRERIRNTLKALPGVDKNLSQLFIISQEFEFRGQFKWRIECKRESAELLGPAGDD